MSFVVPTGTILKEYMESRNITQKDMAESIGVSEKFVSNLINGKSKLSEEVALNLEKIFPDIKAEFWLDIEQNYRLTLLRQRQEKNETIFDLREIANEYKFNYVFQGLGYDIRTQAREMLKLLGEKSFKDVEDKLDKLNYSFMEDGGNNKTIYVWLKLCEYELDIQNDLDKLGEFNLEKFKSNLPILKQIIYTENFEMAEKNIRKYLNFFGIPLVIMDAVPTAKVRGATTVLNNRPVIFLSKRYKLLSVFYFTLVHELMHIINGNINEKYHIDFDNEEIEILTNQQARDFFVDKEQYEKFVEKTEKTNIDLENLLAFSNTQKVIPEIIVSFLEHDKIIDYSKFHYLKNKIE